MSGLKLIAVEEPSVETSIVLRYEVSIICESAVRVVDLIGRHWTTCASVEEAERLLLDIAEKALTARRMLR